MIFTGLVLSIVSVACEDMEKHVLLKKVDFEVDPQANKGEAFACHIAISYSKDLDDRLKGMDAKTYFSQLQELQKTYKDHLELFKFDLIPGKNKLDQKIQPASRFRAKGAYIFAKCSTQGRFAESFGLTTKAVIELNQYKMEVHGDLDFRKLQKKLAKVEYDEKKPEEKKGS